MNDPTINGSHAGHYIATAAGHHGAIVRLQEERDALRAELVTVRAQLAAALTDHRKVH